MVHGVAEQSGGWFGLRSRKGEGTTAELWLPVAHNRAPAIAHREQLADNPATDQAALVVLAVDDDALVLTNTVAMLDELGHEGIAASSGKEALDILRRHGTIDLVITDYAMPYMTGLQLAHAIKAEWPDLPVIIATGFAEMEPEIQPGLLRLAKPFTEAELAGGLERIVPLAREGGRVLTLRAGARSPVSL
jgi:CheY-like chemotaxis protein